MIHYKYSDDEIKRILKTLIIIIDSRENKNEHVKSYLEKKGVPYEVRKLDHGDYGCKIVANPELGIYRDVHLNSFVERKNSIDEITTNLQKDTRIRFESELIRAQNSRFVLVVEDKDGYSKMINGEYRSAYNPQSLLGTLNSFKAKYKFEIVYIDKMYLGNWIYYHFFYEARNLLKQGAF